MIPHASGPKNPNTKNQKQYCNKFLKSKTTIFTNFSETVPRLYICKLSFPYKPSLMEVLWLALFYRWRSWSSKSLSLPKVPQLMSGRMGFEPSLSILLYCFVCQQNLPNHFGFWLLPGTVLAVSLWPTLLAPLPPAWGFRWSGFLNIKYGYGSLGYLVDTKILSQ